MDGILILDKPGGMTSHDVVRMVRRACRTRRVGHAGTLDPMATGVLLVAVGEATRIVEFLMEGEKTYRATLKLGEATDTQDAEGRVVASSDCTCFTSAEIDKVFAAFLGQQEQIPPMFSALKKNGVALHRLARKGVEIERQPRSIYIRSLRILAINPPFISFEVVCSKGTYVRTLCHDIGMKLGTLAHMTALRRIRSGAFRIEEAVTTEALERSGPAALQQMMLSLAEGLREFPFWEVRGDALDRLRHGIPPQIGELHCPDSLTEGQVVVLRDPVRALAIGRYAPSREREKRGDIELFKVFNPVGGQA
jgi:tRNA pseudouridine55 synthase